MVMRCRARCERGRRIVMRCYDVRMSKPAQTGIAAKHGPYHPQDLRRIVESINADARIRHIATAYLPDRDVVVDLVENLRSLLFPGFFGPRDLTEQTLADGVREVLDDVTE